MPSAPRPTQPATTLALLALVLGLVSAGCGRKGPALPGGDLLADLALPTVAGEVFDPQLVGARDVLVMFFSTSCGHCRRELPEAVAAAEAAGSAVLAVMISGDAESAVQLRGVERLSAPVLVDDGTLRRKYGIHAVPYTLVIGANGRAKHVFLGAQGQERLTVALRD